MNQQVNVQLPSELSYLYDILFFGSVNLPADQDDKAYWRNLFPYCNIGLVYHSCITHIHLHYCQYYPENQTKVNPQIPFPVVITEYESYEEFGRSYMMDVNISLNGDSFLNHSTDSDNSSDDSSDDSSDSDIEEYRDIKPDIKLMCQINLNTIELSDDEMNVHQEEICSICLDKNVNVKTKCSHYYHKVCLLELLRSCKNECPYCRTAIFQEENFDENETSPYDLLMRIFGDMALTIDHQTLPVLDSDV